ncbi:MAG: response regulator transcription factor [Armatimonadota bacterium]|jgi:two-component system response regulator RegX3|nr:DNA-binding response regulator [Armatimonadota bacterium]
MARILIVEDETLLAETVAFNLREEGYKADIAGDGASAIDLLRREKPDAVLLDIMLPGIDGLEVCKLIRRESDVPVIMLTAKSREVDKVVGLEVGADDYVTKPFGMMELIARVRAALRRSRCSVRPADVLQGHGLELDTARHTVRVHGIEAGLRPKEFELLHILMANRGRVMERSLLLDRVWGENEYIDAGTVDVHIRRLREKVEENPSKPARILTVRGVGYKFAE